ncbi:MAG: PqqD family protein [Lachnospiraceae bacterium]|nr:PqqD family protein [Lachnospiraceae bacterium]
MEQDNFLDCVFKVREALVWRIERDGAVIVDMENKGFANRIAQRFFKKPPVSHITLQGMGSFVFTCIDGKRTVYDIGILVRGKYLDEAEPLYERLSVYMKQLEKLGFIERVAP